MTKLGIGNDVSDVSRLFWSRGSFKVRTYAAVLLIALSSLGSAASFSTPFVNAPHSRPQVVQPRPYSFSAVQSLSPVAGPAGTAPLKSTDADYRGEERESSFTNPSQAFGSPLSKEVEEFNLATVGLLKRIIFDTAFAGGGERDFARFYALETIARMPYFSYLSVLHLYETLGWWRKANYMKIHFAESWNEMHHLLIMEELGGADRYFDRFIAQHVSVFYYWIVVAMYILNPTLAYNLNQRVEEHAYATYDAFLTENEDRLKRMPAPQAARDYYRDGDLYMFDEFQTNTCEPRRPSVNNLYEVFVAIRDDEGEHVKTMTALQTDEELTTSNDGICDVPKEFLDVGV